MPSEAHQWLLLWAARKMTADGFVVCGYDGPTPQGGAWNALPPPFSIAGVRPDAWGVAPESGELALCEAKSADDLGRAHTQRQLRVFCNLVGRRSHRLCRLYIAVPRSAVTALNRVIGFNAMVLDKHIIRLPIPDSMLGGQDDHR